MSTKEPLVVDNVQAATEAIQDLCDTHDGELALDLEGNSHPTGKISLGTTSRMFLVFCRTAFPWQLDFATIIELRIIYIRA